MKYLVSFSVTSLFSPQLYIYHCQLPLAMTFPSSLTVSHTIFVYPPEGQSTEHNLTVDNVSFLIADASRDLPDTVQIQFRTLPLNRPQIALNRYFIHAKADPPRTMAEVDTYLSSKLINKIFVLAPDTLSSYSLTGLHLTGEASDFDIMASIPAHGLTFEAALQFEYVCHFCFCCILLSYILCATDHLSA